MLNFFKRRKLSAAVLQVNDAQPPATEHINLAYQVNKSDIKRETRDGREHIMVSSYTLPSEIVMNGGMYPAEEIDKAYKGLEGTLAPMGHPIVNGEYVSAFTPEAINRFHVGVWNVKAEKVGNRVHVLKAIDVEYARNTEKGRQLLEAIDKGEPIHTSTGIFLQREMAPNAAGYKWIARNMQMDHDAILIGEVGAATPEQGVGLMVNVADAKEPVDEKGLIDSLKQWLLNSRVSSTPTPKEPVDMTPEELKAILAEERTATVNAVQEAVGKPLGDRLTALETNHKALADSLTANERAKEDEMRTAVKAKFGEIVANSLQGDALVEMFKQCQGTAPAQAGMHTNKADDGYKMELPE